MCVCLCVSLSLSSLLQDSAANYLGRRIGSSLDVACYQEEPLVLAFLLSVVKLIQSEIVGYLRNAVLTVVSFI